MSSSKTAVGDMYSRYFAGAPAGMSSSNDPGTVLPGIDPGKYQGAPSVASSKIQEPVVGFLYSISRNGFGEYWPLHIGKNTIGRDSDNQICLKEMTVTDKHAVLFVRKKQTEPHNIIAQIQDVGSKNGVFINDEEIEYSASPCKNGDVLKIGNNYKLLLILIDPELCGLSVSPDFIPDINGQNEPGQTPTDNDAHEEVHFYSGDTEAMDGVSDDIPGVTNKKW